MKKYTRNAIVGIVIGTIISGIFSPIAGGIVFVATFAYWLIKYGERDYLDETGSVASNE